MNHSIKSLSIPQRGCKLQIETCYIDRLLTSPLSYGTLFAFSRLIKQEIVILLRQHTQSQTACNECWSADPTVCGLRTSAHVLFYSHTTCILTPSLNYSISHCCSCSFLHILSVTSFSNLLTTRRTAKILSEIKHWIVGLHYYSTLIWQQVILSEWYSFILSPIYGCPIIQI